MDNLTDVYNQFSAIDDELEKQASEMVKQAEEEEFAGRIMARGFADELNKLAAPDFGGGPSPIKDMGKGTTIKSKGYAAAGGGGGGGKHNISGGRDNVAASLGGRKAQAPSTSNTMNMKGTSIGRGDPSQKSPFASKSGGGGLMASAVGTQKGQRTSAAPKSYASPGGAKPLNMGKPAGGAPKPAAGVAGTPKTAPLGSVTGKMNFGAKMPKIG